MTAINTSSFYKNMLHELMASIECTDDLLSVLKLLPINKIKHFINEQIDVLDLNSLKEMYYKQMSIDKIFSADILQYMLLFAGFYHTKAVNKQWKKYSEKNESQYLTQLYKPINNDININNTYIIHKYRKRLHKVEIDLGFKGPLNNIEQSLRQSISDDRLLIHNGIYEMLEPYVNHNLHLIGVGNSVTIKSIGECDPWFEIDCGAQCNVQNMKLIGSYTTFSFAMNSILNMENCEIQLSENNQGWWVQPKARFSVTNCKCISLEHHKTIELSPRTKEINIINCTFKNCNIIIDDQWDNEDIDHTEVMELKCIGNKFEFDDRLSDNLHPVSDISTFRDYKFTLQNNVLKIHDNEKECNSIHR